MMRYLPARSNTAGAVNVVGPKNTGLSYHNFSLGRARPVLGSRVAGRANAPRAADVPQLHIFTEVAQC